MNYGTAEQEIVERINDYITGIDKDEFYEASLIPETEAQFTEFYSKFTKARVAAQYIDSQYDPGSAVGIVSQEEKVRFRLTFEARKLRGEGGLYNLMEITKLALVGYRLSHADRLTLVKYGLLEFEQGAWQPYLEFECKTMNIQVEDDLTEEAIGGGFQSVDTIVE